MLLSGTHDVGVRVGTQRLMLKEFMRCFCSKKARMLLLQPHGGSAHCARSLRTLASIWHRA